MPYTSLNMPSPVGWNKWMYVKNYYGSIILPDTSFPLTYTPSSTLWVSQLLSNCTFPWLNTLGLFEAFELSGGISGTLTGSMSGLAVVKSLQNVPDNATFGIGQTLPGGPAPQIGYCIGNVFKQHIYTKMDVFNQRGLTVFVANAIVELLQNSKYKRAYVNHGEVVNYTVNNGSHILTLDINNTTPPPTGTTFNEVITITKSNAASVTIPSFTANVLEVKDNWQIVIRDPGANKVPKVGDFYQLNTTWCVEDPYLMSGFWKGKENSSSPSSGLGLYFTSHNVPYAEGKILGTYIWKRTNVASNVSSTVITSNVASTTLESQPIPGYPMSDASGLTWAFLSFRNTKNNSKIYPDDLRYKDNVLKEPDADGNVTTFFVREQATVTDYNNLINDSNTTHIRVEINTGGSSTRNNWHAPCLKGCYIKSNGKLFKIVDHPEANIIDVKSKSIDSTTKFDPKTYQNYSIINQSAWFINEHYNGSSDFSQKGIFYGSITGSGKNYTISVPSDYFVNWVKYNGLSFTDRYKTSIALASTMKKMFKKFQNWRVVKFLGDVEYEVSDITFLGSPASYTDPFQIKVELKSIATDLNGFVSLCFDSGFDAISPYSRTAYSYTLDGSASAGTGTTGYLVSDSLCLNGEYLSVPYNLDIQPYTRIGFCGNMYFGLQVASSTAPLMLVTTKRTAHGVASLFHALRQEDWIVYVDPITQKLTLRRGSLDFKEYPMKTEIAIGKPALIETKSITGKKITLNAAKERLRRIQVKVPSVPLTGVYTSSKTPPNTTAVNGNYLFVTLGNDSLDSTYGFLVSGAGNVDLIALERMGMKGGNVASNYWTYEGTDVSPVYIYKKSDYQNLQQMNIDVGVDTSEVKSIFVQGDNFSQPSDVVLQYADNNQTISTDGLFDVVRLADGENLVIYSQQVDQFKVQGQLNNSNSNKTRWTNLNAIMAIGSFNDSFYWSSALSKGFEKDNSIYPVMLLNSVDYLGCIYNRNNNTLAIFARCYKNKRPYIGCFVISVMSIAPAPSYLCTASNYSASNSASTSLSFTWRPPNLIKTDANSIWTDTSNLINTSSTVITSTVSTTTLISPEDNFIRVMGPDGYGCQFVNGQEIGTPSTAILDDGTYMFFYDSEAGVKVLFSNNCGFGWAGNNNISLARNGVSGLWLGNTYFFYITPQGIEIANITVGDMSEARNIAYRKKEGNNVISEEINLQKNLDSTKRFLIGSGVIDYQRLSGYITSTGLIKLFYYDSNGALKSMESEDGVKWVFSNNF